MSYVSSVGAYAGSSAIVSVRPNPDYAVAREAAKQAKPAQAEQHAHGPATKVTLSPEALAYLQGQKTDHADKAGQAKAAQESQSADADAKAKAEKAAAARKAEEAHHAAQAKANAQG
ncbi:MAG TPA: hypothetical protein VG839_04105 [Asticcacaulis sp.]|nr:hypothetical protein [Asticcacaulis sp.]